jgi:hypothetical protein
MLRNGSPVNKIIQELDKKTGREIQELVAIILDPEASTGFARVLELIKGPDWGQERHMNLKSPDEAFRGGMSALMERVYRDFGITPPGFIFWPPFLAAWFGHAAIVDAMLRIDQTYFVVFVASCAWLGVLWVGGRPLRADARKEWTLALYSRYLAWSVASGRGREGELFRYLLLLVATWVTCAGLSRSIPEFEPLPAAHRFAFAVLAWSIVFYSYAKASEPPQPGDGERRWRAKAA